MTRFLGLVCLIVTLCAGSLAAAERPPAAAAPAKTTLTTAQRTSTVVWQAKYGTGGIGALPFRPTPKEKQLFKDTRGYYAPKPLTPEQRRSVAEWNAKYGGGGIGGQR